MSRQTNYEDAAKAALEAKKRQENERAKQKAKDEQKKKLASLKSEITKIDTQLKDLKVLIDNEEFVLNKAKKDYQD